MSIAIASTNFPLVKSGEFFQFDINTTGATGAVTPTIVYGALPNGLAFVTHPTNNQIIRIEGTADDELGNPFTIRATDSLGYAEQAYTAQVTEPLDTSKPLIVITGDSIAESVGVAAPEDRKTQGIGAQVRRFLPDFNICVFGWSGYQYGGIQGFYDDYAEVAYDAARPQNFFVLEGGTNDIQVDTAGANTLTAEQLAARGQVILDLAQATGFATIVNTIPAFLLDGYPFDDALRLATNALYRAGGYADFVSDMGANPKFDTEEKTLDPRIYFDGIHPTAEGMRFWAHDIIKAIGQAEGLPLKALFDLDLSVIRDGQTLSPINMPFGGAGTKSYEWFIDDVSVSTDENPDLTGIAPGDHVLRLEVTDDETTASYEMDFIVSAVGDVGDGQITPSAAQLGYDESIELEVSGVTDPIWRLRQGSGTLEPDGSLAVYTDETPHNTAIIEAAETMWNTPPIGSINANDEWVQTEVATGAVNLKPTLNEVGDKVKFYINPAWNAASKVSVQEGGSGSEWWVAGNGDVKSFKGGITLTFATGLTGIEIVEFERIAGNKMKITVDGVSYESPHTFLGIGFPLNPRINSQDALSELPFTWDRPDVSGDGITNYNQGVSVLQIVALPVGGFSVNDVTLIAGQPLEITDESENAVTIQWRITNSFYTNQLVATGATPNLSQFLKMNDNVIKQTVSNSAGTAEPVEHTVTVSARTVQIPNTPENIVDGRVICQLTGIAPGIVLKGSDCAVDTQGNRSSNSNEDSETIT